MTDRFLIVNADDLGMSAAVNEGIFAAHEHGIVTSSSLMVRQSAAPAAAAALAKYPRLAVGLHLDLGGRDYESGEALELMSTEEDCRRQLERFRELVGHHPTHIDSHKHVHEVEPVAAVAEALAAELGVPLRNRAIRYEGGFYGRGRDGEPAPEAVSVERMLELIRSLPPGWTEVGCHPAAGPVPSSSYDSERQLELRTLRDPRVRDLLNVIDVHLCPFAQANER